VGSNFGRGEHPAWSGNLLKCPQATAIIRGRATPVTAELVSGQEREDAWTELVALWPAYADYAANAGRGLRLFRLTAARYDHRLPAPA